MIRRGIAVAATVAMAAAASATASPGAATGPVAPVSVGPAVDAAAGGPHRKVEEPRQQQQPQQHAHRRAGAVGGGDDHDDARGGMTSAERVKEATRTLLRKKIEAEIEQQQQQQREEERASQGQQQQHSPPTPEELEARRQAKKEHMAERRRRAAERTAEKLAKMRPESPQKLQRVSAEEMSDIASRAKADDPDGKKPQNQWLRSLGFWNGGGGGGGGVPAGYEPYNDGYADPGYNWDYWAQGYRMLGGFIDCDWQQGEGDDRRRMRQGEERAQNDRDLSGSGQESTENACGRWMMWAAYVNPNYQGGGYEEYFPSNDDGSNANAEGDLDCHSPDTEWVLMGVYREEFYQYLEQISKHLWAIDDWEYAIALGGLAYMTDADCFEIYGSDGNLYYAGILPLQGGTFQMSLFSDEYCLTADDSYTLDEIGYSPGNNGGDGRDLKEDECRRRLNGDIDSDEDARRLEDNNGAYLDCDSYYTAQEYSLTYMNQVYDTFRYCTLCIDYPTYQDGYFIGDYGTDEDDLINQCWKFHSHDSFPCAGDCAALGSMQGTILEVQVGSTIFGTAWDGSQSVVNSEGQVVANKHGSSRLDRIKANLFLTFAGILFVATFLAFAVARGSGRERRSRSSKSRSLLTPEEKRRARSASRRRQASRSKSGRSKSRGGEGRSSSRAAHDKRSSSRSRKSRSGGGGDGSPRKSSTKSKSSSSRSRRHLDDF